ncbi:phosphomannomutase [Burkholderia ambifaria]
MTFAGVVGKTLDADTARGIGRAFGSEVRAQGGDAVVVARDGRLSGPELIGALADGLRAAGVDVVDVGMVPTPVGYFAASVPLALNGGERRVDSCIVVTGSHNPPDYNGFKMVLRGAAIYGEQIQALYRRIVDERFETGSGTFEEFDVADQYIARIVGDVKLARPLKLVVDAGNGVAGPLATRLFKALGCELVERFTDIDGTFPNHHPDPAHPENLQDVIQALKDTDAELGFAFDGDGDRLGVVTKDGQIIYPDRQLMLFAEEVLSRNPGAQIIYDVKCTRHLAQWVKEKGGEPLMWKTGHSLVKAKLRETGAPLAGEMSGHVFFKDRWYGFDDGLYTARAPAGDPREDGRSERAAERLAGCDEHARTAALARRRRELPPDRQAAERGEVRRCRGSRDDRRPARRVPGRFRPRAFVEHDAGRRDAVRIGDQGRAQAHSGRLPPCADGREAGRQAAVLNPGGLRAAAGVTLERAVAPSPKSGAR